MGGGSRVKVEDVVENRWVKILNPTDKLVMANQPDMVVVSKHQKTAVVIDEVVLSDSNIRKKEHETL